MQKIKKINEVKALTSYAMLSVEVLATLLDVGIDNYIHFLQCGDCTSIWAHLI